MLKCESYTSSEPYITESSSSWGRSEVLDASCDFGEDEVEDDPDGNVDCEAEAVLMRCEVAFGRKDVCVCNI